MNIKDQNMIIGMDMPIISLICQLNAHILQESETSIIVDASKYIKKLKQKVGKINNETTSEQSFRDPTDSMVYKHIYIYPSMHYISIKFD